MPNGSLCSLRSSLLTGHVRVAPSGLTQLWLPQIPSAWPEGPNRAMTTGCSSFLIRSSGCPGPIPVETLARGGGSRPSAAVERAASERTQAPCPQNVGSLHFRMAVPARAIHYRCDDDRAAGDYCALASRRLSHLLTLEVSVTCREAESAVRSSAPDPRDQSCQSALGRSSDSRRAAQIAGWSLQAA
ncbi:MAG: hypothetical protein QOK44_3909 [Betaproteobacteria bacterium]|nr:hypothetical protein [Betaproteobacteria bacterium]